MQFKFAKHKNSKRLIQIAINRLKPDKNMAVYAFPKYSQISNIRRNPTIYHSDVVGASPVGAAPTTSSFSPQHLASTD